MSGLAHSVPPSSVVLSSFAAHNPTSRRGISTSWHPTPAKYSLGAFPDFNAADLAIQANISMHQAWEIIKVLEAKALELACTQHAHGEVCASCIFLRLARVRWFNAGFNLSDDQITALVHNIINYLCGLGAEHQGQAAVRAIVGGFGNFAYGQLSSVPIPHQVQATPQAHVNEPAQGYSPMPQPPAGVLAGGAARAPTPAHDHAPAEDSMPLPIPAWVTQGASLPARAQTPAQNSAQAALLPAQNRAVAQAYGSTAAQVHAPSLPLQVSPYASPYTQVPDHYPVRITGQAQARPAHPLTAHQRLLNQPFGRLYYRKGPQPGPGPQQKQDLPRDGIQGGQEPQQRVVSAKHDLPREPGLSPKTKTAKLSQPTPAPAVPSFVMPTAGAVYKFPVPAHLPSLSPEPNYPIGHQETTKPKRGGGGRGGRGGTAQVGLSAKKPAWNDVPLVSSDEDESSQLSDTPERLAKEVNADKSKVHKPGSDKPLEAKPNALMWVETVTGAPKSEAVKAKADKPYTYTPKDDTPKTGAPLARKRKARKPKVPARKESDVGNEDQMDTANSE